jgi:hypothetical protein
MNLRKLQRNPDTFRAARYDAGMLKYLRIAVTALSLTACVLLIALWVRSYWRLDGISMPITTTRNIEIWSGGARVEFRMAEYGGPSGPSNPWYVAHLSRKEVLDYVNAAGIKRETRYFGRTQYGFLLPIWLFVLVGITVATAPWLPWRFSLRTLLIATTLVATGLGAVIYLSR